MLTETELTVLSVVWRSGLAALLGLVIGWERRVSGSPVRARITALVAMTATALTAMSIHLSVGDFTRVLAGLLTGIGFVGAGAVMRDGAGEVRGLTTAAALWAMTAVSIAIGIGYIVVGLLLALLVYSIISWDDWPLLSGLQHWRVQHSSKDSAKENI